MARYSLIMEDEVYAALFEMAQQEGLSMGKFLNNTLRQVANPGVMEGKPERCFFCGGEPKWRVLGQQGRKIFLCRNHGHIRKKGKSWRKL